MNHILYNLSLLILMVGIILLTVYVTKASGNGFKTTQEILLSNENAPNKNLTQSDSVYDFRPSKLYNGMFSQPSVWFGYSDFDESNLMDKIYVKTTRNSDLKI